VIASGHISESLDDQLAELTAIAATGVDGMVLVTNRLDARREGGAKFIDDLSWLLERLPKQIPLGLYECPAPYRRLLTDDELTFCAKSGRFVILKDVSCDLETVKRRVALTRGTPLAIVNANAAIAYDAMKAGSRGFTGVFTNFHPDLYKWLMTEDASDPARWRTSFRSISRCRRWPSRWAIRSSQSSITSASGRSPAPTAVPSPSISTKNSGRWRR
jgi:4-hydroxy-tetrahydrodipicolinate synthase